MASLRDIRNRIASVKSTRQITNAMKMVSAAKLRRATESATNARPYQQTLTATLRRVASKAGDVENPLLTPREAVRKVLLVLVGTDRGLCGGFNGTLNRRAEDFIRKARAENKQIELRTYGKKPRDYFRNRDLTPTDARIEITGVKYTAEATGLADRLTSGFLAGEFDEAWIGSNQFKSTLTQVPTFTRILPLAIHAAEGEAAGGEAASADFLYEPDSGEILGALLPLYLRTILLQAFLETEAGEHASRMTAMDNATRNASDLIAALTLEYNRGRQAAITKELIEIVSGAEAL